ncbi:MAG: hypothetical protein ICV66_03765 [Chitinophagaceae bacterium]|nr:hypothetical protein [Chitinophagaceae bacterium]
MQYFLKTKILPLFCFIIFQTCNFSTRNDAHQELLASAALKEDFDILRKTLEEAHPGLYWYSDKLAMNNFLDSTKSLIDHDMASIAFFKMLLPVIANIRCSHTNLRLSKSTNTVANQFTYLLPFDFFCQNGKLYIRKSLNGKKYEGREILSINNIETKEILKTLLNNIPADGYNETFKYHLLSNGAFREGFAIFFGQPNTFTLQSIDSSNQQLYSFTVQAIPPQKEISLPTAPTLPFLLNFHEKTAILSVNTFQLNKEQFSNSIESIFLTIKEKGAKHLIIDLRKNGGGINDNVSKLYSYIATAPFLHLKRAEMNATSFTYAKFISNSKSIGNFSNGSERNGKYVVNDRYAGTTTKSPTHKNLFKGDVVLLTSGNTISAASEFAAIAHYLKRAKIVGEETGGCYYGATGGNYIQLKLPNSGFEVRIPTIRIFTAVDEDFIHQPKGRGTFPDYQVLPTINDVITGKDVQLNTALRILGN